VIITAEIRVLIVEDHPMVASGLLALLEPIDGIAVVGCAGSVAEAMELTERLRPHVVCMDNSLPDGRGTDAARQIRSTWPEVQIVMLTASQDSRVISAAIDAGCNGFVTKGGGRTEDLVGAIRLVAAGDAAFSPATLSLVFSRARADPDVVGSDLTEREREVLALLATGAPAPDIATTLHISIATARNHIQSILNKLGAHSKLEAVAIAVRHGLVEIG
jgi:DNA-binding NarL/FixJ family response regulator